ncbi:MULTISPECIES: ABC transporter permease [unclassified Microbispora]|uniref:ABC transporter permease n=1 Tax=unclassified Microbispora TaxID=2614687 RepID=UPI001475367D|nr:MULTISPECIES: ABC transporter permease [unclassified Microbispora]
MTERAGGVAVQTAHAGSGGGEGNRRRLTPPPRLRRPLAFVAALVIALAVMAVLFAVLGADPVKALRAMATGAFGTPYALNQTLQVASVLTMVAIAALIPFRAGVMNVGGEGQLAAGATAATVVVFTVGGGGGGLGVVLLAVAAAMIGAAVWAGLTGVLRAALGANEVIVGLMLNFLGALLAEWVIAGPWADTLAPQTRAFDEGTDLPQIPLLGGEFATALLVALAVSGLAWVLLDRSRFGFAVRVLGGNADAGLRAGISMRRMTVAVMLVGGAAAGLAASVQVFTVNHALIQNPAQGYGYTGIAVALLAGLRPRLVPLAAVLFAALTVGANSLPAVTGVSTSASLIVQGVFVICLIATGAITVRSRGAS